MLSRLLNIVLIFSVIMMVTGVSSCHAACSHEKNAKAHSCCPSGQDKDDCCSLSGHPGTPSDISMVNASVDISSVLLFAVAFLYGSDSSSAALERKHGRYLYSPPLLTQDLPVLNRVFRI